MFGFQSVDCSSGGGGGCKSFVISPNPATSSFKVIQPNIPAPCNRLVPLGHGFMRPKSVVIQSLRIYDRAGNLKIESRYLQNVKQPVIDVSSLKTGVYMVDIFDGKTTERHELIVTH